MSGGPETASPARDAVFAAVMITCTGILGLSLLVTSRRQGLAVLNAERTAARRGLVQPSLNQAIPAVASIWIGGPLVLVLEATQMVLLALTVVVGVLTVVPGRATRLQGSPHLVLLAAFLFLAVSP